MPMLWENPRVRPFMQHNLLGVRWMCRFDFISMFWQIRLHQDSLGLFAFYAGDLGTFRFNRVAMGALNSSCYTQQVMSRMFEGVHRPDGKPLLGNGLIIRVALCGNTAGDARTVGALPHDRGDTPAGYAPR